MPPTRGKSGPGGRRRTVALLLLTAGAAAVAMLPLTAIEPANAEMVVAPSLPCSQDDRGQIWPRQVRVGSRKELVPPGALSLTVCGYNGMNATPSAPQFGLITGGASFNRRLIGRITARLDALEPARGIQRCPADQLSDDILTFAYPAGPDVVLTVDTGGCGQVDNGKLARPSLGATIVRQLGSLSAPVLGLDWPSIAGHLRLCGGPPPGRCYSENYQNGDRVVVSRPGGSWIAMAPIHRGRFSLRVASPGSYTVAFYTGNRLVKTQGVELVAGRTTKVVYMIPIP